MYKQSLNNLVGIILPWLQFYWLEKTNWQHNYLSKAADVSPEYDPIAWCTNHAKDLPNWSRAVEKIFLVQPSSAGAERVFPVLSNMFGEQQENCLEDYIEASPLLQNNKR